MLKNLILNLAITAVGPQTPFRCNVTPLAGGMGRNALAIIDHAIAGGGVINIEGNPLAGSIAPANNDAGWYVIATLNAASPLEQEITLDKWVRANITTVGTGTQTISLEGIQ